MGGDPAQQDSLAAPGDDLASLGSQPRQHRRPEPGLTLGAAGRAGSRPALALPFLLCRQSTALAFAASRLLRAEVGSTPGGGYRGGALLGQLPQPRRAGLAPKLRAPLHGEQLPQPFLPCLGGRLGPAPLDIGRALLEGAPLG